MAMGKLVDMPQITKHTMVLKRPMMMVGFRPYVSDAFPQPTAVILWAMEKTPEVIPAQRATLFVLTPKLLTIEGRYGKTEV